MAKKYLIRQADRVVSIELEPAGDGTFVARVGEGGEEKRVHLDIAGDSGLHVLMVDNRPIELYLERRRGGARATIGRHTFDSDITPWRPGAEQQARAGAQQEGIVKILAPMTGSVVEVRCAVGDVVAESDVVLVIESMKMNNELRAPAAGTVTQVSATPGQRISGGAVLVVIDATREAG